jgi:hypothetical protein
LAYRRTYQVTMNWIGAGMGPVGSPNVVPGKGNAQALTLSNQAGGQNIVGSGTAGIIQNADIATLLTNMVTDLTAQLESATNIGIMQGWETGSP